MQEFSGNIFHVECDALCITTNGFTKSNGEAVMGRGCALKAAELLPDLKVNLGRLIRTQGNVVHVLHEQNGVVLLSFPVKPVSVVMSDPMQVVTHMRNKFQLGHKVPGWACVADLEIIKTSAHQLVEVTNSKGWQTVVLPRPGCGAGELAWETVKPVLDEILDDRFICMTF